MIQTCPTFLPDQGNLSGANSNVQRIYSFCQAIQETSRGQGQAACLRWMTDLSGSTQTYSHNPTSNQECVHSVRTRDARAHSHAVSRHLGELPSLAPDSSAESRHKPYNQRTNALQTPTGRRQSRDPRGTAEQVCGPLCVGAAWVWTGNLPSPLAAVRGVWSEEC